MWAFYCLVLFLSLRPYIIGVPDKVRDLADMKDIWNMLVGVNSFC